MELNTTNDTSSVEAVTRSAGYFYSYRSRSWGSRPRLYAVVRYAHSTVNESQIASLIPICFPWRQIAALYDRLLRIQPSPVVQLNRAVAIAECDGPEAGLRHIDAVLEQGELANYYLAHSARADMYRRLGRTAEASVLL